MDTTKTIAALFDCDGVIVDTEPQYTVFWNEQGLKYLGEKDFGRLVKGQTLVSIYKTYFPGKEEVQQQITQDLDRFEEEMDYSYVPGVVDFLLELRRNGVKVALVTSSNDAKMAKLYHAHSDFKTYFDCILTGDMFAHSKPAPDCFLLGMKVFDTIPENSFVFEDSFHGLQSGRASGATVIGLATTNTREAIVDKADVVIDNFKDMNLEWLLSLKD